MSALSSKQERDSEYLFPLIVCLVFVLLIGFIRIGWMFINSRSIISVFDHYIFNTTVVILSFAGFTWIILLAIHGAGIPFCRLYRFFKWMLFYIYYPLSSVALLLPIVSKQSFQSSFLSFQNRLFLANRTCFGKDNLLLLLPHCLQYHDCKIRVTRDINECLECGKCNICELKSLGKLYNLKIGIANGGTLARKIVNDIHPDVIIAVACHRDLTCGVRDSLKYPVYAILNDRPNGPCFDTKVNVNKLEEILKKLI